MQQSCSLPDIKSVSHDKIETSPISSRTSSSDSQRRSSRHDSVGSSMSGGSAHTPQFNMLRKKKEVSDYHRQSNQVRMQPDASSSQSSMAHNESAKSVQENVGIEMQEKTQWSDRHRSSESPNFAARDTGRERDRDTSAQQQAPLSEMLKVHCKNVNKIIIKTLYLLEARRNQCNLKTK